MYYEKLKALGIELRNSRGQQKVVCPKCSPTRKNKREPCLSVNVVTGDYNCHNSPCDFRGTVRSDFKEAANVVYKKPSPEELKQRQISEGIISFFSKRGITKPTLDHFLIYGKEEYMPQTNQKERVVCFPYVDENHELINVKYRDKMKNFKMVSGAKLTFYNLSSLKGRKNAIIVEGEVDALTLWEAGVGRKSPDENGEVIDMDKWAILSVPNGASKGKSARLEYIDNCADLLMGVEEFIIATDDDEAGNLLKAELIRRLGAEKCKTVTYPNQEVVLTNDEVKRPAKDFNEVLIHFGANEIRRIINHATLIPLEGIYYVNYVKDSMIDSFRKGIQLAPSTCFGELDDYFRWKPGDINTWVGYGNHGKTTLFLQLALTKSIHDGWKWAIFSPENYPPNDFYDDLVEMYCGKWLDKLTEAEYVEALDFLNNHFFYVYPDADHDLTTIHEYFRHLILKHGVDGVLIDPWNQLDHNLKSMQREDQYLSQQLKDVKRFALLNSVSYNIIAHPKTPQYKEDKSLPICDMYDLYGGSMWGNKSDQILSYYRPNFHVDKNDPTCELHVQKIKRKRTGGKHGYVTLHLNWTEKRFYINNVAYCNPKMSKSQDPIVPMFPNNEFTTYEIPDNTEAPPF